MRLPLTHALSLLICTLVCSSCGYTLQNGLYRSSTNQEKRWVQFENTTPFLSLTPVFYAEWRADSRSVELPLIYPQCSLSTVKLEIIESGRWGVDTHAELLVLMMSAEVGGELKLNEREFVTVSLDQSLRTERSLREVTQRLTRRLLSHYRELCLSLDNH
jgi:hypothetical protein